MSAEQNKAVVRRYFDELASQSKFEVADELFAPTFAQQNPNFQRFNPDVPPGPARAKYIWSTWREAFPDWQVDIADLVAEGDRVAARITAHGTHLGELRRPGVTLVHPTGKAVSITATVWFTVAEGRIAALEETGDFTAFNDTLGIRPVEASAPA